MADRRTTEKAEISAIYEVGKILTSTQNLTRALGTSLRTLQSLLGFDRAAILLPDSATREIRMQVSAGYTAEERSRARYVWGEGIVGKTMKSGGPTALPDVRQEPSFLDKTRAHGREPAGPLSYIAVPIKIGTEILGVLTAERIGRAGTQAMEADTRALTVIGCLIGQALKLHAAIERLQEEFQKQRQEFEKKIRRTYRIENIVGQSKRMQEVFAQVVSVAPSRATVLLRGESGTGKEMIARAIHAAGPRADAPFVTVNCAALPETLLESELFGHKRGAFTGAVEERKGRFEQAGGGTIFLDEVGDIPLATQVKLLRVLQEREFERLGENRTISVDVRIIAATNVDLEKMVEEGRFREDLFYRLNVIPVFLPPLRDRRDDILPLTEHFLERFNREHGKGISFTPEALEQLIEYRWPGNVRELENLVERAVVMAKAPVVGAQDLPRAIRISALAQVVEDRRPPQDVPAPFPADGGKGRPAPATRADLLLAMEREELRKALESTGWVIARAAKILGWTPRQVAYKMRKHSLQSPWK
ncbi:MAG TPA: nif-specific transcriptional activator NifA [Candidatus Deferrimicrobiaceae bacterium]|nr:nif-specific transcriptional activator NifA [Candidatus Deferrimicrobiaceae bacterium]